MEKKKIHIAAKMPCNLAMSHIDCFLEGLRTGAMVIEQGQEKLVLHPHAEVELDIDARTKEDKQQLTITLEWQVPEEYQVHSHEHQAVHQPPLQHSEQFHQLDEHGFHTHYHCHGKGEHQLCHSHEHSEGHHDHHQYIGCCEDKPHAPHQGCCAEHYYGAEFPEGHEAHQHGYRGCCEGIAHTPHTGCCAEHGYGEGYTMQHRGEQGGPGHGKRFSAREQQVEAVHGEGYKVWHKGRGRFFDHKHPQHFSTHKMFHGTQTHHKPHGRGENYHRSSHTAVPPKPRKEPAKH